MRTRAITECNSSSMLFVLCAPEGLAKPMRSREIIV